MRILELIPNLASGGAERFVTDLSNELVLDGNDVSIFTFRSAHNLNFYKDELLPQVCLKEYPGSWTLISKLIQFFVILSYVRKFKPEVIHCHTLAFPYALFVSFFYRNIKYYYTVHNLAENDTSLVVGAKIRCLFLKKRIIPITISKQCAHSFTKFYGYSSFCTIENGCRSLQPSSLFDSVKNEIESYKKTNNTKVFINIARISKQKNHKMLVDAFNLFSSKDKDSILLIIGHKFDAWNDIKKVIETSEDIFYLGEKHNVADYLLCSDFFCLSSLWEGLPISLLEAGILGVCPICTPVGGVKDVICDKRFGILSRDISLSSYLEAIKLAVNTPMDKHELMESYTERYSMKNCAKKYLSLFLNDEINSSSM